MVFARLMLAKISSASRRLDQCVTPIACSEPGGGVTVADRISAIAASVSTVFGPPGRGASASPGPLRDPGRGSPVPGHQFQLHAIPVRDRQNAHPIRHEPLSRPKWRHKRNKRQDTSSPSRRGDELVQGQRRMPADLLDRFGDLVKLVMRSDDPEYFPEPRQVLDRVRVTVFV